jgi:hypothetical protein
MKFSAEQIEFLLTKLTMDDIAEASSFKSAKSLEECCRGLKKNGDACRNKGKYDGFCASHKEGAVARVRAPVVVPIEEQCCKLKRTGEKCIMRAKVDGLCSRHKPKVALSEETVVDSESSV